MYFEKNYAFNHRSFSKTLYLWIKSVYHLFPVYHHWSKYGTSLNLKMTMRLSSMHITFNKNYIVTCYRV